METLIEDCRCIFFHPRDPERRAELEKIANMENFPTRWDIYASIKAQKMLGPCETRGE